MNLEYHPAVSKVSTEIIPDPEQRGFTARCLTEDEAVADLREFRMADALARANPPARRRGMNVNERQLRKTTGKALVRSLSGRTALFCRWALAVAGVSTGLFLQADTGPGSDAYWDDRFFIPGVGGRVNALAAIETNIYVGGSFGTAGAISAANVARWDGWNWHALGQGVRGSNFAWVSSFTTIASGLFVGGSFDRAGEVAATNAAFWDGTRWHALGAGVPFPVTTLATFRGTPVAGIGWNTSGVTPAWNLGGWDGAEWTAFGGGVNGWVNALASDTNYLYVGGQFTQAGGKVATNIARWNGAEWESLGDGVRFPIAELALEGGEVFALAQSGSGWTARYTLIKWDGRAWTNLTSLTLGLLSCADCVGSANALLVTDGQVYVGGEFDQINSLTTSGVVRWDGAEWMSLGSGVSGHWPGGVQALLWDRDRLCAGGWFQTAGDEGAQGVAFWDGVSWSNAGPGKGRGEAIHQMTADGPTLVAAGPFSTAASRSEGGLAQWSGSHWTVVPGLQGSGIFAPFVRCVDARRSKLVLTLDDRKVLERRGTNWAVLGEISAPFLAEYSPALWVVHTDGTNVYAGGQFAQVEDVQCSGIAHWDGRTWHALQGGLSRSNYVAVAYSIASAAGSVYVGGAFTRAGSTAANSIARWDGQNWLSLGEGVDAAPPYAAGGVHAIAISGSDVYAGGRFDSAGGIRAANIARWDGSRWHALAQGLDGEVSALAISSGMLYAAVNSWVAGFNGRMARWDGASWTMLGTGFDDLISSIIATPTEVYVSGRFRTVAGKRSSNFAVWHVPMTLHGTSREGRLSLSWPMADGDAVLERSPSLSAPVWVPVNNSPELRDQRLRITEEVSHTNQFYRLRMQL